MEDALRYVQLLMAQLGKEEIVRESGERVYAIHPLVVSASRSTDIPAFYSNWFFHRLKVGYSVWTNPFNNKARYVAYDQTRFIVFWSKNPRPLLEHLDYLDQKGISCYIQYTLNDYQKEGLEKNVPSVQQRIDTFKMLVDRLGLGGVVWRFDPLILTKDITVDDLLEKVRRIGDQLKGYTEKLVFSFADILEYHKVKTNLEHNGIPYIPWDESSMIAMANGLAQLNRSWGYELATCAEKTAKLKEFGIKDNRCIDTDLIVRRGCNNCPLLKELGVELRYPQATLFDAPTYPDGAIILPDGRYYLSAHKKDTGQRKLCQCAYAKDIGQYDTCPHKCEYCYANTSKESAEANYRRHLENSCAETIVGINPPPKVYDDFG